MSLRSMVPHGLKRLYRLFLALTVYRLSAVSPRNHKRWVFGSQGDTCSGNPRFLFLWMRLHRPDINVVWMAGGPRTAELLKRAGHPVVRRGSLSGLYTSLRAAVYVYSHGSAHISLYLSGGAYRLNLWHGVGVKSIHLKDEKGPVAAARQRALKSRHGDLSELEWLQEASVWATTSDMMQKHFSRQFDLPESRFPQLGYPRLDCGCDVQLREESERIDSLAGFQFNPEGFKQVYVYAPTFRDTNRPFFELAFPDVPLLERALKHAGALLYIKPHPQTRGAGDLPKSDWVRLWPNEIDLSTYLSSIDVLVTDYSSILYDYVLVRGGSAIIYDFDYDQYVREDRALAHDFSQNVTGLRISDFPGLCDAIAAGSAVLDQDSEATDRLLSRFWAGSPMPASPKVVSFTEAALATGR